ncbi:MAG: cytidylate kinase-like family protein [Desulfuromonadaceae bacterium]|nr:cytidylate kinase-like family protein [Desulfuromonadaceae bacterium]MDD2847735.1 cytidylate kinase-like family protein [Desulfuromonadaceae bacterium]MDD4131019.1 cytidylate kinase-like family protein [Desulfuromonadaceae bacterium]
MSEKLLVPSIEMRLGALLELGRRQEESDAACDKPYPAITLSREFGCEAFPVTECLKEIMEKRSGQPWTIMDKALLEEVAKHHHLSEEIVRGLGEKKSRLLDEVLATFSPHWKSDKDHFRLLCKHVFSLAEKGNTIIVGRGGAIVTQQLKNCYHFRLFASHEFKVASIARRLNISKGEADSVVEKNQKQRNAFIRDYFNTDPCDLRFYHLAFNNNKNSPERIAQIIAEYVTNG